MAIELSREQFRTTILYDWKIGLNYMEKPCPFGGSLAGTKHLPIGQSLTGFHEYERRKLAVSDSPRSGRPRAAVTDKIIDAV